MVITVVAYRSLHPFPRLPPAHRGRSRRTHTRHGGPARDLYRRTLDEVGRIARFADAGGFEGAAGLAAPRATRGSAGRRAPRPAAPPPPSAARRPTTRHAPSRRAR